MVSQPELDLSQPIYGLLDPKDPTLTMHPDEKAAFSFFIGGGFAVRTVVQIDQIDLLAPGTHLERFSGTDVSSGADDEPGIAPGKTIIGIKNHNLGIVFLTDVDERPVEPYEGFYNEDDDRER